MRVLLLSHTTGYQLRAFNDAAERLGFELLFATDRCHRLDDPWQDRAVAVRFHDIDAPVAAIAAEALGIVWHTPAGAAASIDKRRSRAALAAAGLPSPRFTTLHIEDAGNGPAAQAPPESGLDF